MSQIFDFQVYNLCTVYLTTIGTLAILFNGAILFLYVSVKKVKCLTFGIYYMIINIDVNILFEYFAVENRFPPSFIEFDSWGAFIICLWNSYGSGSFL